MNLAHCVCTGYIESYRHFPPYSNIMNLDIIRKKIVYTPITYNLHYSTGLKLWILFVIMSSVLLLASYITS